MQNFLSLAAALNRRRGFCMEEILKKIADPKMRSHYLSTVTRRAPADTNVKSVRIMLDPAKTLIGDLS